MKRPCLTLKRSKKQCNNILSGSYSDLSLKVELDKLLINGKYGIINVGTDKKTDERVIVKTELYISDTIYAVGTAEEFRNSSFINKTSALENCSSSALGRCLAAFGLSGSEYASAEELVNALNNQNTTTQSNNKTNSIENEIKKQTTETKLTALYSDWKKNNNSDQKIEKLFEQQQQLIKKNGGQNNVNRQQW